MQRELPIAEIDGVDFYVDVLRDQLWQVKRPSNTISFSAFLPVNDGYCFVYHRKKCCWAERMSEKLDKLGIQNSLDILDHLDTPKSRNNHCLVTLPALMELDPEGMALCYEIPLKVLCPDGVPPPPKRVIATVRPLSTLRELAALLKPNRTDSINAVHATKGGIETNGNISKTAGFI